MMLRVDCKNVLFRPNPFLNSGDEWKRLRNDVSPAMTTQKVGNVFFLNKENAKIQIFLLVETNVLHFTERWKSYESFYR